MFTLDNNVNALSRRQSRPRYRSRYRNEPYCSRVQQERSAKRATLTFPVLLLTPYVMVSLPPTTTESSLNLNEELSRVSAVNGRASIPSPSNSYSAPSKDGISRVGMPFLFIYFVL